MKHLQRAHEIIATLAWAGYLLSLAAPAAATPCTGNVTGAITPNCRNLNQAKNLMPCGVTSLNSATCSVAEGFLCEFEVGSYNDPNYIEIVWETLPDKTWPGSSRCGLLMESIEPCGVPVDDCPNISISEENQCGPDNPFCFAGGPASSRATGERAGVPPTTPMDWAEPCHAYALMPRGWNEWTGARGFFAVGRTFPLEAVGWEGVDGRGLFGARQALAEGRLGETLLGIVTHTPLWGATGSGHVETDWAALGEAGLCFNPQGALLASPFWRTRNAGVGNFAVLTGCSGTGARGLGLYTGRDQLTGEAMGSEAWQATGALASQVLTRLQDLESRGDYDLVCVTPELADRRRAQRAAAQRPGREREPAN